MANQKGDTTSTGHFWNRCIDAVNKKFETFSFWNKASDTEFDDGSNAETKVGAFKGITSDLNTTTTGYAADMTTVAKLNSSLISDIYVGDDGKLHKTKGGADTVLNFSGSIEFTNLTISSNSRAKFVINTNGYKNILIFDYATQWTFSSVNNGNIVFNHKLACAASDGSSAGKASLILVSNVSVQNLELNRSGSGTGTIRTPVAYGY